MNLLEKDFSSLEKENKNQGEESRLLKKQVETQNKDILQLKTQNEYQTKEMEKMKSFVQHLMLFLQQADGYSTSKLVDKDNLVPSSNNNKRSARSTIGEPNTHIGKGTYPTKNMTARPRLLSEEFKEFKKKVSGD